MPEYKFLHIYGQEAHHDEVYIVGSRESLTELRNAIDQALENRVGEVKEAMVADGEGYTIGVLCYEKDWKDWRWLAVPYSEDYAKERREEEGVLWPIALEKYLLSLSK